MGTSSKVLDNRNLLLVAEVVVLVAVVEEEVYMLGE